MKRIALVCAGGMHQALHIAPVAVSLSQIEGSQVAAFVLNRADQVAFELLLTRLGDIRIDIQVMAVPRLLEWLLALPVLLRAGKGVRLLFWNRSIGRYDAVLAAERTTTILKNLPWWRVPMIHIPHGAGDRAKGFEPRLARFDHIIVSGPKDRQRMIAQGLVAPDNCTVSGSIKVAACKTMQRDAAPLFDNARPTIIYNPHFDHGLGSFSRFAAALIDAVIACDQFNLIVAPHIRMFEAASLAERDEWQKLAVPGQVIIDLASPRLSDMSYTNAADIYLGDVSSQVYEYLTVLRPCVFINAHNVVWRGDPNYAMWQFGPVCNDVPHVMRALEMAGETHAAYIENQRIMVADALGDHGDQAPKIAARQLLDAIARFSQPA